MFTASRKRVTRAAVFSALLFVAPALAQVPAAPAPLTETEQLRKDLTEALTALAIARAARGDCEATLAPLEAQARRSDIDRRWDDLKRSMDATRPGFDCNPRTGECAKKPEPAPPKT